MEGLIIYKGKYGATQQYASWIGQELSLPLSVAEKATTDKIESKDFLIIGTSIYIGKFQIKEWLERNIECLKTKKIYLFIVSATPAKESQKLQAFVDQNVPLKIRRNCEIYFLPGRLVYKKLSFLDKLKLRLGAALVKDPIQKKKMLTDFNLVKKENLSELIKEVKNYNSQELIEL